MRALMPIKHLMLDFTSTLILSIAGQALIPMQIVIACTLRFPGDEKDHAEKYYESNY